MEYTFEKELNNVPKNVEPKLWAFYLRRKLTKKEMKLLRNVRYELEINKMLEELYHRCVPKDLYVPELSGLYGNCLFESLCHHGLTKDVTEMRQILSYFLYQFQDQKGVLPGQPDTTFKDIFSWANEVEYVYCHTDKVYYKYTYNLMCQDLADDCSWTKIPTQLVLMVVHYCFDHFS